MIMTKKNYTELLKDYGPEELANSFIFLVKLTGRQKKETDTALRDMLEKRRASLAPALKLKANLLQVRFQIEDYLDNPHFDKSKSFGFFLKLYINGLNKKRNEFAREINIKPAVLSQYINDHRDPPKDIMVRLEIHSKSIIRAIDWYRLLEKKAIHELGTNNALRRSQKRFVKMDYDLA
jgi:hypothetical protein